VLYPLEAAERDRHTGTAVAKFDGERDILHPLLR
jgi:hypothetical protein